MQGWLERTFRLSHYQTTVRTEVLGGLTTFVAMAYIIVVNPAVLKDAGIHPGPGTVATILAAVFGCALMGLFANRPFAVAPYMGENVFIAYGLTLLLQDYHPDQAWRLRLGTVFVSGVIFFVLTLVHLRTWLARAISPSLKHSFAVGIGLFLFFLGLLNTGIVVPGQGVPLKLGDWQGSLSVQLALLGFLLMVVLQLWRVRGAILLGMVVVGVLGVLLGLGKQPQSIVALPWAEEYHLGKLFGQLDVLGVLRVSFLPALLTLVLISFLDTLGTLVALGSAGGLLDKQGNLPDMERPMIVDSLACIFSALVGTSTSGAFVESATGIREGARTGLAALTTAALFALALFFLPLIQPLQELRFAYGPALMLVGLLMFGSVRHIDLEDWSELVPAVGTITLMVFTFNIANGLTAGLILHPLMKLCAGRWYQIHPASAGLGLACLAYYAFGLPH